MCQQPMMKGILCFRTSIVIQLEFYLEACHTEIWTLSIIELLNYDEIMMAIGNFIEFTSSLSMPKWIKIYFNFYDGAIERHFWVKIELKIELSKFYYVMRVEFYFLWDLKFFLKY